MADIAGKLAPGQRVKLVVAGYTHARRSARAFAPRASGQTRTSRKNERESAQFLISRGASPSMISPQSAILNPSNDTPQGKNRRLEILAAA